MSSIVNKANQYTSRGVGLEERSNKTIGEFSKTEQNGHAKVSFLF